MLLTITVLVVSLVSIALRFVPLSKVNWVGVDTFYHLVVSRDLRERSNSIPGDDHFYFKSGYSHPPLLHFILSAFPSRAHRSLQYLGPLVDIASAMFVFIAAFEMLGLQISVLVLALYITAPILIDSAWTLGSRSLANLFLVALLSLRYSSGGDTQFAVFLLAAILVVLVALTHRLYSQILVVVSVADFAFTGSLIIVVPVIVGFGLLLLNGRSRNMLRGHILFIRAFRRMVGDISLTDFIYSKRPNPITLFFNSPLTFVLVLVVVIYGVQPTYGPFFVSVVLSTSILLLSVVWPYGQGYRHLAGLAFPCALGVVLVHSSGAIMVVFMYGTALLQLLIQCIKTCRVLSPRLNYLVADDFIRCLGALSDSRVCRDSEVLLVLPLDHSYAGAYFSDFTILEGSGGEASGLTFNNVLRRELGEKGLSYVADRYNAVAILLKTDEYGEPALPGFSSCCKYGTYLGLLRMESQKNSISTGATDGLASY
jgi:hypothetical protein